MLTMGFIRRLKVNGNGRGYARICEREAEIRIRKRTKIIGHSPNNCGRRRGRLLADHIADGDKE